MELKFVAPGTTLVPIPGVTYRTGQAARRVGARWDADLQKYVLTNRPHVVRKSDLEHAMSLKRLTRKGQLWPADADTARACGVRFQPLTWLGRERGWAIQQED